MVYSAQKGEYIFDVAAKLYGDTALGIQNILALNPGLDLDSDLFGVSITYNSATRRKPVFPNAEKQKNTYFYARDFQSVYDVSLQLFGNLTGLGSVLLVHQNLDQKATIGTEFTVTETSDPMVDYYLKNKIISQTFVEQEEDQELLNLDGTQLLNLDGTPLFNL